MFFKAYLCKTFSLSFHPRKISVKIVIKNSFGETETYIRYEQREEPGICFLKLIYVKRLSWKVSFLSYSLEGEIIFRKMHSITRTTRETLAKTSAIF